MKSITESNIYSLFAIFYFIVSVTNIKCKEKENEYKGRCIYLENDTGSKIMDFHKFKNINQKDYNSYFLNEEDSKNWSINICNDTVYENIINNTIIYNSQIVWHGNNNDEIIRVTGPFYRNSIYSDKNYISKEDGNYSYNAQKGDQCNEGNYSATIQYIPLDNSEIDSFVISQLPEKPQCAVVIAIKFNKEKTTDYLILQQLFNDYFFITGSLFILFGIFLCFFSFKYLKATKIIICLIFGQIIFFNIDIAFIGNSTLLKDKLYILVILIGILIGLFSFYINSKYERLYLYLLAFSSGYVNGIFVFDMCFIYSNCSLSPAIFVDVIFIFIASFISLVRILPRNNIYYPPVIGSYILMRGISLFIYNLTGKMRFIDLQLLLYLVRRYEDDLINQYLDEEFKYFWIYIILNLFILILSEIINNLLNKNEDQLEKEKDDDDDIKREISDASLDINTSLERENKNSIENGNMFN